MVGLKQGTISCSPVYMQMHGPLLLLTSSDSEFWILIVGKALAPETTEKRGFLTWQKSQNMPTVIPEAFSLKDFYTAMETWDL